MNRMRGITLLETVVWTGILVLVMGAIVSSITYFYKANAYAFEQASATASIQRGLEKMVRVIREAAYASDGAYPIVSMSTSTIVFYANTDDDPYIEKVKYTILAATTTGAQALYEVVVKPAGNPLAYTGAPATSTLSDYVHNVDQNVNAFVYYDKNGAQVTDYSKVADVRFVTVTLLADVNPYRQPAVLTFRSSATLRNLMGQ